jgi:exosortase
MTVSPSAPIPTVPRSRWLAFAAIAAIGVLVSWAAWHDLVVTAINHHDSDASILAPPIAIWLLWQRRAGLAAAPRGQWLAVPFAVVATWLSWWGSETDRHAISHLGALLTVSAAFTAAFGTNVLFRTLPAWGALLFSIPMPGAVRRPIAQPLQGYGAQLAESSLNFLGFSVERLGASLVIDGVPVAVSEACDGMRMVSALALVVWAVSFGRESRPGLRLVLLVSAPLIALACNAIRLVPTVIGFALLENKDAEFAHDVLGWLTLPLCLGLIELLRLGLEWLWPPREAAPVASPSAAAPARVATASRPWLGPVLSALAFAVTWWFLPRLPPAPDVEARYRLIRDEVLSLPTRLGPWRGEDIEVPLAEQRILKPNAMLSRSLSMLGGDERAHLLLIHCRDVRDMLGHWPASCYVSAGWQPERDASRVITVPNAGLELQALRHRFSRARGEGAIERTEVWSAFLAPGEPPTGSLNDLAGRAGGRMRSRQGIAQVQVCFPEFMGDEWADRAIRSILEALPPDLLRQLKGDFSDEQSVADTASRTMSGPAASTVP